MFSSVTLTKQPEETICEIILNTCSYITLQWLLQRELFVKKMFLKIAFVITDEEIAVTDIIC